MRARLKTLVTGGAVGVQDRDEVRVTGDLAEVGAVGAGHPQGEHPPRRVPGAQPGHLAQLHARLATHADPAGDVGQHARDALLARVEVQRDAVLQVARVLGAHVRPLVQPLAQPLLDLGAPGPDGVAGPREAGVGVEELADHAVPVGARRVPGHRRLDQLDGSEPLLAIAQVLDVDVVDVLDLDVHRLDVREPSLEQLERARVTRPPGDLDALGHRDPPDVVEVLRGCPVHVACHQRRVGDVGAVRQDPAGRRVGAAVQLGLDPPLERGDVVGDGLLAAQRCGCGVVRDPAGPGEDRLERPRRDQALEEQVGVLPDRLDDGAADLHEVALGKAAVPLGEEVGQRAREQQRQRLPDLEHQVPGVDQGLQVDQQLLLEPPPRGLVAEQRVDGLAHRPVRPGDVAQVVAGVVDDRRAEQRGEVAHAAAEREDAAGEAAGDVVDRAEDPHVLRAGVAGVGHRRDGGQRHDVPRRPAGLGVLDDLDLPGRGLVVLAGLVVQDGDRDVVDDGAVAPRRQLGRRHHRGDVDVLPGSQDERVGGLRGPPAAARLLQVAAADVVLRRRVDDDGDGALVVGLVADVLQPAADAHGLARAVGAVLDPQEDPGEQVGADADLGLAPAGDVLAVRVRAQHDDRRERVDLAERLVDVGQLFGLPGLQVAEVEGGGRRVARAQRVRVEARPRLGGRRRRARGAAHAAQRDAGLRRVLAPVVEVDGLGLVERPDVGHPLVLGVGDADGQLDAGVRRGDLAVAVGVGLQLEALRVDVDLDEQPARPDGQLAGLRPDGAAARVLAPPGRLDGEAAAGRRPQLEVQGPSVRPADGQAVVADAPRVEQGLLRHRGAVVRPARQVLHRGPADRHELEPGG